MTTVSAVMNPTAPAAPAPTAPSSPDSGASFEAALTQALGPTAQPNAVGQIAAGANPTGPTVHVAVPHLQAAPGASRATNTPSTVTAPTGATTPANGPTAAQDSPEPGTVSAADGASATDSAQVDVAS